MELMSLTPLAVSLRLKWTGLVQPDRDRCSTCAEPYISREVEAEMVDLREGPGVGADPAGRSMPWTLSQTLVNSVLPSTSGNNSSSISSSPRAMVMNPGVAEAVAALMEQPLAEVEPEAEAAGSDGSWSHLGLPGGGSEEEKSLAEEKVT